MPKRAATMLLVAVLPILASCGLDVGYLLPQAWGQLDIIFNSVSITDALASGELADWQERKLRLILDARRFAGEELHLNTADAYETFYNTGSQTLAWNVSACAKHTFAPKMWEFPLVGTVPYLGYFDQHQAADKVLELRAEGLDVLTYEVNAYSTLDFLPNPVFSGMLEYDDLTLVDTICHELLHGTVWSSTSTTFNESLATFVGRRGAIDYFVDRRSEEPIFEQTAIEWYADIDTYNAFVFSLFEDLQEYYGQEGMTQTKAIDGREAIFQAARERFVTEVQPTMFRPEAFDWAIDLPTNNAWILANTRYNQGLEVFAAVHAMTGEDWRESLRVFREAAKSSDPYAFLEQWVASGGEAGQEDLPAAGPAARLSGGEPAAEGAEFILDPGPFPRTIGPGQPFSD
jgi:predicted aminopeptidase